jgi:hypothetical protein
LVLYVTTKIRLCISFMNYWPEKKIKNSIGIFCIFYEAWETRISHSV